MSRFSGTAGLLLLFGWSVDGHAATGDSRFENTVTFSTGALFHKADAAFGATLDDNPVVDLTLPDLGVGDDKSVFWADLSWKMSQRWKWDFTYSSFAGNGLIEARRSGNFGEIEFDAGASLSSDIDVDVFITDITYDLVSTDRGRFGIGAGFHVTRVDFDLLATIDVMTEDGGLQQVARSQTMDVLAPLPTLSITGSYRLLDKVRLSADVGYLSLNIDKYDGGIFSARTQIEWRPWQRIGIGAGYQFIDLDLDVDQGRIDERYDLELTGPTLFLTFGF
ncbi:MAG TPA: hypothetical protein VJ902_10360 [Wenzhouxiangellaceae bacterium]|nr:hypothetical protein [Wenzhouxiangellaceae bacterium]